MGPAAESGVGPGIPLASIWPYRKASRPSTLEWISRLRDLARAMESLKTGDHAERSLQSEAGAYRLIGPYPCVLSPLR